ncbi:hypothetical protein HNP37_004669 [Flavobacterium nitrogenifigens]|uniref:DUF559 domain-containing protein n=2 Tax=Flavobacterium TaxID=237 RepID=A0A7W7NAJ5_9FLAO|nr:MULTISPECIES: hypothetical protein [Flavobacterium]MBB4804572.1 hypothetical protein [Flavobacterium nitrogenifigens]MBB6389531.1 hypothetical protein [Flavobacterium notoginsengisoli]
MAKKTTRNIAYHNAQLPEVALRSPTQVEKLPFPYVHYPEHYGTFISFSEQKNSEQFLCLCSQQAVINYFELSESISEDKKEITKTPWQPPFPSSYLKKIKPKNRIDAVFKFRPKLCHRCNMTIPSLRWCHEMYGGNFKQYYGWYIQLSSLKLGFNNFNFLPDICPSEVIEKLKLTRKLMMESTAFESEEERLLAARYARELARLPENAARTEFGFRKIGEGWISETILFRLVTNAFPLDAIERNIRPDWLENLELDIYLPQRKLAFEYQGQQHFHPIKAWGGSKAFENLQKRDEKKRNICLQLGIVLIEINYTEPLTLDYLLEKVKLHTS